VVRAEGTRTAGARVPDYMKHLNRGAAGCKPARHGSLKHYLDF